VVVFVALLVLPLAVMTLRKRSFKQALYAVASWCFHSAGMVRGLLQTPRAPMDLIASKVLREPAGIPVPAERGFRQ
jgi:hypothetical protein